MHCDGSSTVLATRQLLYRLERGMKEKGLGPKEKVDPRRKEALPLLESLKELLEVFDGEALPSGKLGEAIQYTLNEWPHLVNYV